MKIQKKLQIWFSLLSFIKSLLFSILSENSFSDILNIAIRKLYDINFLQFCFTILKESHFIHAAYSSYLHQTFSRFTSNIIYMHIFYYKSFAENLYKVFYCKTRFSCFCVAVGGIFFQGDANKEMFASGKNFHKAKYLAFPFY